MSTSCWIFLHVYVFSDTTAGNWMSKKDTEKLKCQTNHIESIFSCSGIDFWTLGPPDMFYGPAIRVMLTELLGNI